MTRSVQLTDDDIEFLDAALYDFYNYAVEYDPELDAANADDLRTRCEELRTRFNKAPAEGYASTSWSVDDVLTLREGWTEEQAEEFLVRNEKWIVDAMAEAGWTAMEVCIQMDEAEAK